MLHWADVFNGYIRGSNDTQWQLLLRRDNLRTTEYAPRPQTPTTDNGVFAARFAPSNSAIIYAAWNGFVYKSIDGGTSFSRTAFAPRRMQSNMGPQRRFNRALDVHPVDPDQVIIGTNNDGVHFTRDGGKTWSAIDLPPAAQLAGTDGKFLVAFAARENVYVHVPGTGLYRSTSGVAGPFSPVGGPPMVSCLATSPKGRVYVCEYQYGQNTSDSALQCYDGTGWTLLACPADQVAIDPHNENHLFAVGENLLGRHPVIRRSLDGGQSWTAHKFTRGSGEVSWLSDRDKASFPAQILFDPVIRGKLWMADGVGVTWSIVPEPGAVWTLHDYSNGNAELVPVATVSIPSEPPILCFWDKPFWRLENDRQPTNMWSYPIAGGKSFAQSTVMVGYGVDYAEDDHKFLVGVAGQGSNLNGRSTDAGRTWTEFAAKPAAPFKFGGAVAVSTRKNFIILSANNGSGAYTLDGGETWLPVSFGGYDPVEGWIAAYYINRLDISADKTRSGTFAAVVHNIYKLPDGRDAVGRDIAGLWLTRDGGVTWTRQFSGVIQGAAGSQAQFWQCRLRYVPGRKGELLYADCSGNPGNQLMWSADDGASWTDVRASIRDVTAFGFGMAAKDAKYPAVYFFGKVGGVAGVYASFDWFETEPRLLSKAPLDTISTIADVSGDLNIQGRCYAMIAGNGAALCDLVA